MQPSDDLVIQIFFWTSAFLAVVEAMKASGWRVWAFGVLGFVLVLIGAAWSWLKELYPPLTGWITSIATNPQSWFLLLVLFLVLVSVTGRAKRKQSQDGKSIDATEFVALNNSLQEALERIGTLEQLPAAATAEDHSKLITTVVNLTKDTNARVERLAPNPQVDRDILLLMHFVVYQSTVHMLDDLLRAAPPVSEYDAGLQIGGDFVIQNAQSNEFIDLIRRKIDPGSWRRSSFEGAMSNAANVAEHELEKTPVEQRPAGIDQLALRRWVIAHKQCITAVAFLKHEKKEAEENLLSQRFNLLQRYVEKNK